MSTKSASNATPQSIEVVLNLPKSVAEVLVKNANLLAHTNPVALDRFINAGETYFNPLVGFDAAETFVHISDAMGLLTEISKHDDFEEFNRGIELFQQTVWTAAQFSAELLQAVHADVAEVHHG
ncbi:MAG: hypothetical protein J0653_08090 [Deltaproteobacteria bacterium]|nr:hypothetical protein [Deltaproteobacteria bacterium]